MRTNAIDPRELMHLHVAALFTGDAAGGAVNEPVGGLHQFGGDLHLR